MPAFIPIIKAEPSVEFPQPDGSTYLRSGHCCRCGQCCKSGDPFTENQTLPALPCRHLSSDDGVTHACTHWDNPWVQHNCAVWPSAPGHVVDYPGCTYVFDLVT